MKLAKIILAAMAAVISAYGLITKNYQYSPLSSLMLGLFFGLMGIEEYKTKGKNGWGHLFIAVSALVVTMALFSIFL